MTTLELEVGPVAHGGHCVARHAGRVVFVRHALPGELVRGQLTDTRSRYARADAVEVLRSSPDRVTPPCPYAGPGRCGGCDWQHAALPAQRRAKAAVVAEQLSRLAGVAWHGEVAALPGAPDGLGWRSRVRFAVRPDGTVGLHRHRSHQVEPVQRCLIADGAIDALGVARRRWPGAAAVTVAVGEGVPRVLVTPGPAGRVEVPVLDAPARIGPGRVAQRAAGRRWRVAVDGFWQVHPAAADVLSATVRELLAPVAGERALDLYAGAGLFAAALGDAVGDTGDVLAIEADAGAVADAAVNLADLPWVQVRRATVDAAALAGAGRRDVVVLDPPRRGAGAGVVGALAAGRPRAVCYVACDPAALARDIAGFAGHGYRLAELRAFDLFPMTAHVECVALLVPGPSR